MIRSALAWKRGGREIELAAAPATTRSERHDDVRREGARIHFDSDDFRLRLLADLQLDLEPIRSVLELEGIALTAEFRVERERRAWRRAGYHLQRRVFYGPLRKEVSTRLFRSERALQLDFLHR